MEATPSRTTVYQLVSALIGTILAAWCGVLGALPLDERSPVGTIIFNMPENSWAKVSLSRFDSVWTPEDQRPSIGPKSPKSILRAWSSMAWDSNRGKLIFFGGGHANYSGNEVYLWNGRSGLWERASLPSEIVAIDESINLYHTIDGYLSSPISAHTYDNSEFLPIADRFISVGGAAYNTGGSWVYFNDLGWREQTGPYLWDPSKADPWKVGGLAGSQVRPLVYPDVIGAEMWENRNSVSQIKPPSDRTPGRWWGVGTSDYSPEDPFADVVYFGDRFDLYKLTIPAVNDPSQDVWEKVGVLGESASGQGAGTYDIDRNLYVRSYGLNNQPERATFAYWDLNQNLPGKVLFSPSDPSGKFDFGGLHNFGLDYDPIRGQYLLWNGSAEVWKLTPPTAISSSGWTLSLVIDASQNPDGQAPAMDEPDFVLNGILGKWKYIPEYDIYLGVNTYESGSVWAYKPFNWSPVFGEPIESTAPTISIVMPRDGASLQGTLDLEAVALDDAVLDSVTFFADSIEIGRDTTFPYSLKWTPPAGVSGEVLLTALAEDRAGNQATSTPVTISFDGIDDSLDNEAPSVSFTSPLEGSSVSGSVEVRLDVIDSSDITKVTLAVDGDLIAEDLSFPFEFTWDSSAAEGQVLMSATATDSAGNVATSSLVLNVVRPSTDDVVPPVVEVLSPQTSESVFGNVEIRVSAFDDQMVREVRLYASDVLLGTQTMAPYLFTWNSDAWTDSTATIRAEATDASGNVGVSETIDVVVNASPALEHPRIEWGSASANHLWQRIELSDFSLPAVVILSPPTSEDADPGVARMRGVGPSGFDLRFQEWDYLARDFGDLTHGHEVIRWVALSVGRYEMSDGTIIEVGTFPLSGDRLWSTIKFSEAFPNPPRLFLTVQTEMEDDAISARAKAVRRDRFRVALHEEEALRDGHQEEVVGYLAIYSAADHGTLESTTGTIPYSLRDLQLTDEWGPFSDYAIRLEEEQSADSETDHIAEMVQTLQLYDAIFAQDVSANGADPIALRVGIGVEDSTPPTVTIQHPLPDSQVFGIFQVSLAITDDRGIDFVELVANNQVVGKLSSSPYSLQIDSTDYPDGQLTLFARAVDLAGNEATSQSTVIEVSNEGYEDEQAPEIGFLFPSAYQTLSGEVTLEVGVSDQGGISEIRFLAGGELIDAVTAEPYSVVWDSTSVEDGSIKLEATAVDEAGNSTTAAINIEVVNKAPGSLPDLAWGTVHVGSDWTTIAIPSEIAGAVIFAACNSYNDPDPGVVRLRSVASQSFEVSFQEWDYLKLGESGADAGHAPESISWFAAQPGRFNMADGSILEIGTFELSGDREWTTVKFEENFPAQPYLFLSVQTENDAQTVSVRAKALTTSRFRAALHEEEALKDGHGIERVAYFAIYSPGGSALIESSTTLINATLSQLSVSDAWTTHAGLDFKVEEEQSANVETKHVEEDVHILRLEGTVFMQDVSSLGGDPSSIRSREALLQ